MKNKNYIKLKKGDRILPFEIISYNKFKGIIKTIRPSGKNDNIKIQKAMDEINENKNAELH